MEGKSKAAELCLGCLCTPTEHKIHDYKIGYAHFWEIFEVSTINLCYLCKRIAQHAEIFIQNVQSNQLLLQNCVGDLQTTIQDARSQLQPSITLSHTHLDPTVLSEKDETNLESTNLESKITDSVSCNKAHTSTNGENGQDVIEMRNEDAIVVNRNNIKVELKVEDALDHLDGGFVDENDEFEAPYIKEEDDFPQQLLKRDLRVEVMKLKALKALTKNNRNKREENNEALGIKKIFITKEQCMEERKQQALEEVYINCAYKCVDCVKGFNYKAAYDNHLRRHREEMGEFKCEICNIRMDSNDKMSSHKKCHTIRFQCTECGIVRTSRSTLLDHHNAIHKKGESQFACPYCPKSFKRQMSQRKHIRYTHQNKERVTCAFCQKSYANKEVIKTHIMTQHSKEVAATEPAKKYPCKECGMMFRTRTYLKTHSSKHSLSRDYYCVECDKAFKSERLLKQHLKNTQAHVNNSDLPLCCDQCEKRFAKKRHLDRHMNSVHLEVKPFKCDKCDKAYGSKSSLTDHKRQTHGGYKPTLRLSCSFCDKTFCRSTNLKAHIRTHTGERPYQCDKCPSKFSQSGSLFTHKKLVHQRLTRDGKPKQNAPPPHKDI